MTDAGVPDLPHHPIANEPAEVTRAPSNPPEHSPNGRRPHGPGPHTTHHRRISHGAGAQPTRCPRGRERHPAGLPCGQRGDTAGQRGDAKRGCSEAHEVL